MTKYRASLTDTEKSNLLDSVHQKTWTCNQLLKKLSYQTDDHDQKRPFCFLSVV